MSNPIRSAKRRIKKNTKNVKVNKKTTNKLNRTIISISLFVTCFLLCQMSLLAIRYSTVANKIIVKELTNNIFDNGGISALDTNVSIEGSDFDVINCNDYTKNVGENIVSTLKDYKELGILKTNVNLDDLWAIYYLQANNVYNNNQHIFGRLSLWFNNLNNEKSNFEYTCEAQNCQFVQEMSTILAITEEQVINSNAHRVYHEQLYQSGLELNLDNTELQQVYEAYLLTNPELIKSITINYTLVNNRVAEKEKLANWATYGNEFLVRLFLGNIRYNKTYTGDEITKLYKFISPVNDKNILTEQIIEYVPQTVLTYGLQGGLQTSHTTITNVSDVENLDEWLQNYNPNSNTIKKDNVLDTTNYLGCSFGVIHWELADIQFVDNIPTFEEFKNNTELMQEVKESLSEQTVWQMIYTNEE